VNVEGSARIAATLVEAQYALAVGGRVVARYDEPVAGAFYLEEADLLVVNTQLVGRNRSQHNIWAYDGTGRLRWRVPINYLMGSLGERYYAVGAWSATRLVAMMQNVGLVVIDAADGRVVAVPRHLPW
jgi:outer membrane protein assembly factor BamB